MYLSLVICSLLLLAGGAVHLLAQSNLEPRQKTQFAMAAIASVALKLIMASRWHDFDVGSYGVVSALVLQGKSVYASTTFYNYAPIWALFVAGFKQIANLFPAEIGPAFHVSIAAFLAVVDVALAALLSTRYRYGAGIFYLCCPITVLLTGFYSQFEDFAMLAALVAWLLIREGDATWRRTTQSAGLLGLSLAIKHVFFLFPMWLLFWSKLGSLRKRLAYVTIAYGLFAVSFVPWATNPESRAGIYQHVFLYRSRLQLSFLHLLAASDHFWIVSSTERAILPLIWIVVLMAAGLTVARSETELFPMYLLAMFAVSPAQNDYYSALPMLACAILFPCWPIWAFVGTSLVALFASSGGIFYLPFNRLYYLAILSTQITAGALFIVQQRQAARPGPVALSPWTTPKKALTLALGSVAVVFLILLFKAWILGVATSAWLATD